jgi:antitoxin MazE
MILSVVKIGNSRGIRLPKALLEQCRIRDRVNVEVTGQRITLQPIQKAREGWDEQMMLMHQRGEDGLLVPEALDSEFKEWEW